MVGRLFRRRSDNQASERSNKAEGLALYLATGEGWLLETPELGVNVAATFSAWCMENGYPVIILKMTRSGFFILDVDSRTMRTPLSAGYVPPPLVGLGPTDYGGRWYVELSREDWELTTLQAIARSLLMLLVKDVSPFLPAWDAAPLET